MAFAVQFLSSHELIYVKLKTFSKAGRCLIHGGINMFILTFNFFDVSSFLLTIGITMYSVFFTCHSVTAFPESFFNNIGNNNQKSSWRKQISSLNKRLKN